MVSDIVLAIMILVASMGVAYMLTHYPLFY